MPAVVRQLPTLEAETLRRLLRYDPLSGRFAWAEPRQGLGLGRAVGHLDRKGYVRIKVDGVAYLAHRLAFLYMAGQWPTEQVDHIDGDRANNRWVNLREATNSQNQCNRPRRRTNKSGFKGVHKRRYGYRAEIWGNGRLINLGSFASAEAAHRAYVAAAKQYHGEFARVA